MIRTHEFNTRWYGEPAGIIDDPAFFALPEGQRRELLAPYAWVEFKAPLGDAPHPSAMLDSRFFLADVQIPFRIRLSAAGQDVLETAVASALEMPFAIDSRDMAAFTHERFVALPGMTVERIAARYGEWAAMLIGNSPATCLRVEHGGRTQGWFLAEPHTGGGIGLTLAMLHRQATISGLLLYSASLAWFANAGYRVGDASFSVRNTAVENLYASLGARFTAPIGIWMSIR